MMSRINRAKAEKRDRLINEYIGRGYSANRIQRELQREDVGMQRKRLLKTVRSIRRTEPRPYPERHIPIRYRWIPQVERKQVCVYGYVDGRPRRAEIFGSGTELFRAMLILHDHPPKQQFLTISANELSAYPRYYLMDCDWDERPEVES